MELTYLARLITSLARQAKASSPCGCPRSSGGHPSIALDTTLLPFWQTSPTRNSPLPTIGFNRAIELLSDLIIHILNIIGQVFTSILKVTDVLHHYLLHEETYQLYYYNNCSKYRLNYCYKASDVVHKVQIIIVNKLFLPLETKISVDDTLNVG